MNTAVATEVRPSSSDAPAGSTLLLDADLLEADLLEADLFDDADDELLVEEISIDGMCGVY